MTINDIEAIRAACGMINRSGHYCACEFRTRCGINPSDFPRYFTINDNRLVVIRTAFRKEVAHYFATVRGNWPRLGIAA